MVSFIQSIPHMVADVLVITTFNLTSTNPNNPRTSQCVLEKFLLDAAFS